HCYWAAAQVFHLAGDSGEATRALQRARRLMVESARELDAEDRTSFLGLPWHVDLMEAVRNDAWPDPPR
ncbi:MAG TPA: hypothetical protein VKB39_11615, partial [Candidatus Baltobacteraceae bacterium]|nr:hypothetical protein [Candidatus Baltobacteraceae bacterium]